MKTMTAVIAVSALLFGCTATLPVHQEALLSIGIAVAIEEAEDQNATVELVLKIASAPLSVSAFREEVEEITNYPALPPSQQLAIDAILAELDRQVAAGLTPEDRAAALALWQKAAILATSRFTAAK